ncbi:MAG: RecX family transcriptional regulator [Thermoanaerobaculia bacterium]
MDRPTGSCREKALQLLARRPHFKLELARKLSSRGFGLEAVESSIERLENEKYLDDYAFAMEWAAGSLRRRGLGVNGLRRELQGRGLEDEVAGAVVERSFPNGDGELAETVGRLWSSRGGKGREALARHLERKGFSQASIWKVLEKFEYAEPE